jgi:hypothetical protein
MDQAEVERLKAQMEWEGQRTAPPKGFPKLPDMPAARYTDQAYFDLEQSHIFRKRWMALSARFTTPAAIEARRL